MHLNHTDKITEFETGERTEITDWIKLAAGMKLNPNAQSNFWQYSVGGALTPKIMTQIIKTENSETKREKNNWNYEVSCLAKKSNVLLENDEIRFGGLVRIIESLGENLLDKRVGASYMLPNEIGDFTVAVNTYDTRGNGEKAVGIRTGIEQTIKTRKGDFALRTGFEELDGKKYSFGLGYENERFTAGASVTASPERDINCYGLLEVGVKF